jgi:hypothetical protein
MARCIDLLAGTRDGPTAIDGLHRNAFLVYIHTDIFGAGHKGCSFLEGLSSALKTYSKRGAPFYIVSGLLCPAIRASVHASQVSKALFTCEREIVMESYRCSVCADSHMRILVY